MDNLALPAESMVDRPRRRHPRVIGYHTDLHGSTDYGGHRQQEGEQIEGARLPTLFHALERSSDRIARSE